MNTIFLRKGVVFLPGLAAFAVLASSFSAMAQTVDTQQLTESSATATSPNQVNTEVETANENLPTLPATESGKAADLNAPQQFSSPATQETASWSVPGTATTSSASLKPEVVEANPQPSDAKVAQSDIDFGRPTRGGRSYIGVGANIGLGGGESSIGDGNFAVLSKIGLTNAFSIRPAALFGNNTTILVPVTYDFSLRQSDPFSEPLAIAPYVGVGAALKTGDDSQVAVLVSGGIDVPLSSRFTATAGVNAGFFDQTDVGLLIGVGYNFSNY
ncbi:hypothetical protein H6G76_13095 [Nostoc sp. FACHB-152]|uniref:hypothetical protein n=1 Tax=unclassified Nostoc TaxID=2593658 RepID=UPI001683409A|nr:MULTISPECIES: hypothetical protein [unclassified Nostoc]MBD2448086.1 hypothetical protein [Nostoc sp. FACHB-152]MBD2467166.1 hypothetical protein [Nostoc sp. FACHB-145]